MPSLREAQLRHAAYYLSVLRTVDGFYEQGDEPIQQALTILDSEWNNIATG